MKRSAGYILGLIVICAAVSTSQDSKENADFRLAMNLYQDKFYDLALEQFRQFVAFYPNTQQGIEARYHLGLTQKELKRYGDARLTLQNFALSYSDHPKAPEAWMRIAETFLIEGNKREAALTYERIRTFHTRSPLAPTALRTAAELYDELRDRENTLRVLKVLTQEYPTAGSYGSNLRLAELYAEIGQTDNALLEARKIIDGSKEADVRTKAMLLQSRINVERGRSREAESTLGDIVRNFRTTAAAVDAQILLGRIAAEKGDASAARASWSPLTEDDKAPVGSRQDACLLLGDLEEKASHLKEAYALFDRGATLAAGRAGEAAYRAGRVAERLGDTIAAATHYERSAADTSDRSYRAERLVAAIKAGVWTKDFERTTRYSAELEHASPDHPAIPRVLLLLADNALRTAGMHEEAEATYGRAFNHPRGAAVSDRAMLGIARARAKAGDHTAARIRYQEFLDRFPASRLRNEGRRELSRLETYVIRDRDAGTEQLALLMGDMIGERSQAMLSFRLAEISFLQLKNYSLARDQYERAIKDGLNDENAPVAQFRLGRSLEFLSGADGVTLTEQRVRREQSRQAYDRMVRQYPSHPLTAEAMQALVELTLADAVSPEAVRALSFRVDSLRPGPRVELAIMLSLARKAQDLRAYEDALRYLARIPTGGGDRGFAGEALARRGAIFVQMGAVDSAASVLSRCLLETGDHAFVPSAGLMLARLYADSGKVELLRPILRRLAATYVYAVDTSTFALLEADALSSAGRPADAAVRYVQYRASLESDVFEPGNTTTEVLFRTARAFHQAGNGPVAIRTYSEVVNRSPSADIMLESMYAIASLAEAQGDLPRAASAMQEAARLAEGTGGGNVWAVRVQSADLLFRNEQYAEAMKRYTELQKTAPSDSMRSVLESHIIVCAFRLDNLREADRRSTLFVRAHPRATSDAATFELERAKYLTRKGDLEIARRRFEIVLQQYPKESIVPEALTWLGRTYELGEQPDSAGMMYDRFLQTYPTDPLVPRVELSLANVYYTLEQWDKAVPLYRRLVENEGRAPDLVQFAMNNLILAYKQMTLYDAALQLTRTYIERYPDDPELINKRIDIGVLYQKLGYYDQSIVHLQDLLLTAPSDIEAELRYYIGEAHYYKGDYQQGILEFLKVPYLVARRGPIDWVSTSYYMAGQSYEKLSRFDQSIAMYKQIIDRPGIDAQFKTAAQREIDRVEALVKSRR